MAAPKRKLVHSTRPDVDTLSINDVRFCQHYAQHDNAFAAYKQAGYHNSDSNDVAVRRAAVDKLTKPHIRHHVRQLREQSADAAGVTVEMLAQGFRQIGFADRTAIFDADGSVKPPGEWPDELKSIVTGFEVIPDENGKNRYKVKFERSLEARKILAQWRGMIGTDATVKDIADSLKVLSGVDESKMGPPS